VLSDSVKTAFLQHSRTKGLSDHTLRAYRQDLTDFQHWGLRHRCQDMFVKEAISGWMADMRERQLAATSIKRRVACLKVLFRWLEENGDLTQNPFHRFRATVQLPRRLPRNLTHAELKSLFASAPVFAADNEGFARQTLHLALELLFTTGIRVGELCSIRLEDIDLLAGTIKINGKGNRERRVFLVDDEIITQFQSYVSARQKRQPVTEHLLIKPRGSTLTPDQIRKHLHAHVEDLKLPRRITPHMLRHTAATQLLETGVDIRLVQKLLGHASISTTEIYTHVSDTKLQAAIRNANPRRKIM
jgi:site-specific recombinase XerD